MSKAVGVLGSLQLWSERPYRFVNKAQAEFGCRTKRFRQIRPLLVQELAPPVTDGGLGVGNALPFSRTPNKLRAPHRLHYETPHAGDTGVNRHLPTIGENNVRIHVSARLAPEIRQIEVDEVQWFLQRRERVEAS